jgi:hypothetical protein
VLKYHAEQAHGIKDKQRAIEDNKVDSATLEAERKTNSRANEEQNGGIKVHNTENGAQYIDKCSEVGRVEAVGLI